MNLYQKLDAITAEIGTVAKNLNVATSKTQSYKAVGERDVIDAVKPIEHKYGVYSYPASRETVESERLESESEYQGKITKRTTFYTRLKTVYRFVNIENPEEYVDTTVFSVGIDSQDKGDGKAMTYGDKYALMKAYKISTGDDPDQQASVDADYTSRPRQTSANDAIFKCEVCGNVLVPYKGKDGKTVSLRAHAERSRSLYDEVLCIDCINKRNASKDS